VITKAPVRRFQFQNRQAAAALESAPGPESTPSLASAVARLNSAFDRIAASLDEIRAGLDRIAAALGQMPDDPKPAAPLAANGLKPGPKPPRSVRTPPEPVKRSLLQDTLPLDFS
jgi:hypothetical protein